MAIDEVLFLLPVLGSIVTVLLGVAGMSFAAGASLVMRNFSNMEAEMIEEARRDGGDGFCG